MRLDLTKRSIMQTLYGQCSSRHGAAQELARPAEEQDNAMGRERLQLAVSIKTTTQGARHTRARGQQQSNASTTQNDAKREGQTSNNDKRLRADRDPDSLRQPELGGTPTKKPRITSFGVNLDDFAHDDCSLQSFPLRKIIADPGVRRELASWRWLAIYALVVVYSIMISHHIMPGTDKAQSKLEALSDSSQFQPDAESGHHLSQELLTPALDDVQHEGVQALQNADIVHKKTTSTVQNLNTDAQCYRDSAHAASIELAQLRAEVRNASGPLVLGGIGDSGTRAIAYLVTQLGVWMGKYGETVKKDSRDSRLFINGFNTVACDEDGVSTVEGIVKSYVFYSRSLAPCGSLAYNQSCIANELTWNRGTQWTSALFRTLWRDTKTYTPKAANQELYAFGLWGFKHPRASFILPYINHVLDGNFKYVHILRDGRDIAAGDNQYFFNSICKKYHGPDSELCTDKYENKLELWARLNLDILRFAREHFGPKQFMVVRIEDFVLGDLDCFQRLAGFSGTSRARAANVIDKSIRLFTVKKDRYFGNKYSATQRREFTQTAAGNPIVRRAYHALGYGLDPWQPVVSCSEIPTFGFS